MLIRSGANVNARSDDGRTPLLIAASRPGAYAVVQLLLDHKANPSVVVNTYRGPMTPLRQAAEIGDEALYRLLHQHGADAKAMGGVPPLVAAVNSNDPGCLTLALKSADRHALKDAGLFLAPPFGAPSALRNPQAVRAVFEAGADIAAQDAAGRTLLMRAVASDEITAETLELMIGLGADVNTIFQDGRTALDYAQLSGRKSIVELLRKRGANPGRREAPLQHPPKPATSVRAAIVRSLPLLQHADAAFLRKSGCVSCHNNSLTAMTVATARQAGLTVDERLSQSHRREVSAYLEGWRERVLQGMGIPGDSNTVNWLLVGLGEAGHPADLATDAMAIYLKNDQMPDGRWRLIANRPPLESSEFEATAFSLRALQLYAPKALRSDYEKSVWRAADWLRSTTPRSTADQAGQLLGLTWAGDSQESLHRCAKASWEFL